MFFFTVKLKSGDDVTFLDTPGHSAFASSRKRVLEMIDLVILIVAADDGVLDQTLEIINNVKKAKKRILIAINKVDKENANVQKIYRQLLENVKIFPHFLNNFLIFFSHFFIFFSIIFLGNHCGEKWW